MPTVPKVEGELLERAKNVYRDLLELGVLMINLDINICLKILKTCLKGNL